MSSEEKVVEEEKPDEWVFLDVRMKRSELEKLKALAESRTQMAKGKRTFTPEDCIRDFIQGCVTDGGGWETPSAAAIRYEKEKREKAQAKA